MDCSRPVTAVIDVKRRASGSTDWADRRTGGRAESNRVTTPVVVPTLKRGPHTALCRSTRARRRFSVVQRRPHPSGWGLLARLPKTTFLRIITGTYRRLVTAHD